MNLQIIGDKSNHVATIHLAQMLYIWPLFAFFSVPLLLPYALQPATAVFRAFRTQRTTTSRPTLWIKFISSAAFLLITVALSLAVVKYNTIIHPFTLADNRHYMFYVFRYTIRRARWIPFALVLPYTICRWLVWSALSGSSDAIEWQKEEPNRLYGPYAPPKSSTALVWLLATTLSLITAPLVEPRYFIIPWVLWRLMVPLWQVPASVIHSLDRGSSVRKAFAVVQKYNILLWLETAWFVIVNAATMYIFLMKPYQWKSEDGTLLDDGRWQRFMW